MTSDELAKALGVNRQQVGKWVKRGMPHSRNGRVYVFDDEAVREWLLRKGIVEAENVVGSYGDVANHFGVSERTVQYWKNKGMPGEPGYFNLDAVKLWREEQGQTSGTSTTTSQARERLIEIEVETKALRLAILQGNLVELDQVRRLLVRHVHEAKSVLERVPDLVLAELPVKTPKRIKRRIRATVTRLLDDACELLADMCRAGEVQGADKLTRAHRLDLIRAATAGLADKTRQSVLREVLDCEAPQAA
jgi:excisionase family DNA binding protein